VRRWIDEGSGAAVNVYVQFSLAMCAIVLISLVATAYLAASFNRRAKADLAAALGPLAELIDGEVSIEDAEVRGRYAGHLAFGRMANAAEGPGRVFQAELIDPAGGAGWRFTSDPARRTGERPRHRLDTDDPILANRLSPDWNALARSAIDPIADRYRLEYDSGAGLLRFSRPMRTRRDIPAPTEFRAQLDLLVSMGPINRDAQGAPDADWAGGRRPVESGPDSGVA
jgi:hypothetical protein